MATHKAVATLAPRAPLGLIYVPTVKPSQGEVRVRVEWTASTPLDMHQNEGGLLVNHPQILGDGTAGTVVEVGEGVESLRVGDKVFGFTWRTPQEKAHQIYVTVPTYLLGKIPENSTPQEAVTLGNNFVTVFHALTKDLDIELPYPKPEGYVPGNSNCKILIWGGSSSVGQYAVQILRYWGYANIGVTSSRKHWEVLKSYGAGQTFDYRDENVTRDVRGWFGKEKDGLVLDCIGSLNGSLIPISKIVGEGTKVAVLLPVIVRDASDEEAPIYSMDVEEGVEWEKGVEVRGVRTHFYLDNPLWKEKLQSEIMPRFLAEGIVKPNKFRIIEGDTLLERAQRAMDALRRKEQSGERLVWRVAE